MTGEVVNSTPRPLHPQQRPDTHCVRGGRGVKAGLDGWRKISPHRDSIPGPSRPQPVAIPTELCRVTQTYIHTPQYTHTHTHTHIHTYTHTHTHESPFMFLKIRRSGSTRYTHCHCKHESVRQSVNTRTRLSPLQSAPNPRNGQVSCVSSPENCTMAMHNTSET